ncbi:uncharacterized protein METZ01_LOCUS373216, partial [marine metagenome]
HLSFLAHQTKVDACQQIRTLKLEKQEIEGLRFNILL